MPFVILGGGISGMLAAYVLRHLQPVVLERSAKGSFLNGGLKYLRATAEMRSLLDELKIPYTVYTPSGALFWRGTLYPYPVHFKTIPELTRVAIQKQHWYKTRGTLQGFTHTCMNDPMGEADAPALRFDMAAFWDALESGAKAAGATFTYNADVSAVAPGCVILTSGQTIPYSDMITTLHVNIMKGLAPWIGLPTAAWAPATVCIEKGFIEPDWKRFSDYDYIYTPDVLLVHRISKVSPGVYQLEAAGKKTLSDFQSCIMISGDAIVRDIPGHLLPLESQPSWPSHIYPLGRFAQWQGRITSEKVLTTVLQWKQEMGWTSRHSG